MITIFTSCLSFFLFFIKYVQFFFIIKLLKQCSKNILQIVMHNNKLKINFSITVNFLFAQNEFHLLIEKCLNSI